MENRQRWTPLPLTLPSRRSMEFDLFHSGVTSLVHSIELFASTPYQPDRIRFALIAFVDGIELLLKAQLAQEHKVLIFQDVDRPLRLADFETVLRRLETIALYPLLKRHVARLHGLNKLRQDARHMKWTLTDEQAAILVTDTLPFLDILLEHRFDVVVKDVFDDGELWHTLLTMQQIAREARDRADHEVLGHLRAAHEGSPWPWRCPVCLAEYFVVEDPGQQEGHCLYCDHRSQMSECLGCGTMLPEEYLGLITHRCTVCTQSL